MTTTRQQFENTIQANVIMWKTIKFACGAPMLLITTVVAGMWFVFYLFSTMTQYLPPSRCTSRSLRAYCISSHGSHVFTDGESVQYFCEFLLIDRSINNQVYSTTTDWPLYTTMITFFMCSLLGGSAQSFIAVNGTIVDRSVFRLFRNFEF